MPENHMSPPVLTDAEILRLKKIAQEDERLEWFWATVRRWVGWIAGAAAMLVAFRADIAELFKWIFGK